MTKATQKTEAPAAEIRLNIGKELSTGTLGDTPFDAIPGGDVAVYTTAGFEQKTAGEAAPPKKTDLEINVRNDFRGAAAYGVKIELNAEGVPVIYKKAGKKVLVVPANANDAATAPTDGVAININKDRAQITLLGGEKFDITPDGNVTSYESRIQLKKLTEAPSLNPEDYQQVRISQGFNAVAMNNSVVELTADKTIAVATDGISRRAKKALTLNPVVNG